MDTPKLTLLDRRVLTNQFKIMAALDVGGEASTYAHLATIAEEGYALDYDRLFQDLSEPLSSADCMFVRDVLEMYTQLQYGFEEAANQGDVSEREVVFTGSTGTNSPHE